MKHLVLLLSLLLSFNVMASWDQHKATIAEVSFETKVQPELIMAVALLESSFRKDAKAAQGSSKGIMGITDPTWKYLVGKYGNEFNVKHRDRMTVRAELTMGAMYLNEITEYLKSNYKRNPTYTEIYLGYKFGPQRALEMLSLNKTTKLVDFYPEAAERNKAVYFKENTPRTVAETARVFKNRISNAMVTFGNEVKTLYLAKVEKEFAVYKEALANTDCIKVSKDLGYRCVMLLKPLTLDYATVNHLISGRKYNTYLV